MKKLILCILDGVGITDKVDGNAFKVALKPNFDYLYNNYPHSLLDASGTSVGLPEGVMGNSEVGHINIGAGRVVFQNLQMINEKIKDKSFFENEKIIKMFDYVKKNNSKLHLMGLISDGEIHSSLNHLEALIEMCELNNIEPYIHAFTDGRDTLPNSSLEYINRIQDKLNIGKIASIGGRYYAMDRDNRYERVEQAYNVLTGISDKLYNSYSQAIKENYDKGITDEFIEPGLIVKEGIVENNDGIIFFNFRPDRLRELGSAFTNDSFNGFERKKLNVKLLTMMPVSNEVINETVYELQKLDNTFGEYISQRGLSQLRLAETEKYAHVTYYFDGGLEKELENCKRILIPSPKVATYDLKPEMSAHEITDVLMQELSNYDVTIINYANGDMVGHTGVFEAALKAVETIDDCLGKLIKKAEEIDALLIITADHGNCEYMKDDKGNVITSHSTNKVPFIIANKDYKLKDGKLGDIAPTLLKILNISIPEEMTGDILID